MDRDEVMRKVAERVKELDEYQKHRDERIRILQGNLRARKDELVELLREVGEEFGYPDLIYRFYHHSFKVQSLQTMTINIVNALRGLCPEASWNKDFDQILREGTPGSFRYEWNDGWHQEPRRIVEAFFHAKYFLEMAVRCVDFPDLGEGDLLPSDLAGLLYFYNLR